MTEKSVDVSAISEGISLDILDSNGNAVKFGSLFDSEKVIAVFIRHFFCGNCQDYVIQLASVRKEALAEANAKIVVIGCGDWHPIKHYAETTGFQGPIYADPTRKVYHALGMKIETLAQTPSGQTPRSYLNGGALSNVLRSIWRGPMKNPTLVGKQGNLSQLGGDFVFGPGCTCSFASRMQHTQDHVEVADLMQAASVSYP